MANYTLRQQILRALRDCYPGVSRTEEVHGSFPLFGLTADQKTERVVTELKALMSYGFVENARGDAIREPLWRITGEGLAQINQEAEKLDVRIWDSLAY